MLVILMTLAAPVPAGKAIDGWVGKPVFRKELAVRLYVRDAAGRETATNPTFMHYRVVRDEGADVRVIADGKPAWFRKADVLRPAAAAAHFGRKLETDPKNTNWLNYRAVALKEADRFDEAVAVFDVLLAESPQSAGTWHNNRATVLTAARRFDAAVADLTTAIRLDPSRPIYYRNRGWAYLSWKKYADAVPDLTRAIELEPANAAALAYRATARAHLGDEAGAAEDAAAAVRAEPLSASAVGVRGWLLAVSRDAKYRDPTEAVRLTELACDLTGWGATEVDAFAAAVAAAGDFAAAVRWQELALRDAKFRAVHGPAAERGLALFRDGKPFRVEVVEKGK